MFCFLFAKIWWIHVYHGVLDFLMIWTQITICLLCIQEYMYFMIDVSCLWISTQACNNTYRTDGNCLSSTIHFIMRLILGFLFFWCTLVLYTPLPQFIYILSIFMPWCLNYGSFHELNPVNNTKHCNIMLKNQVSWSFICVSMV